MGEDGGGLRVAVENSFVSDPFPTGFKECVFFCVETETGCQRGAACERAVTSRAYMSNSSSLASIHYKIRSQLYLPGERMGKGEGRERLTAPVITIPHPPRNPIIPRRNHPPLPHQHAPNPSLHTIAPPGRQTRQLHEIGVP